MDKKGRRDRGKERGHGGGLEEERDGKWEMKEGKNLK